MLNLRNIVLALLAVLGILGLERAVAPQRGWRIAARCVWGTLLAVSIAFNLADICAAIGFVLMTASVWGLGVGRRHELREPVER